MEEKKLLQCLRELADAAESVVHLVDHPSTPQKRLQIAIKAANDLLAPRQAAAA